ncbi:MAG: HAD family hydrolase, partial [Desulfopila sp.]|nr:HAD family hydrolase [Desulfopila sp.]
MKPAIHIIFTDLDGTLLNSSRKISAVNSLLLEELHREKVIRVIATGRSLFSFNRLFSGREVPADYLIFSSGAGIIDLAGGALLHKTDMMQHDIHSISNHLQKQKIDFMVHHSVPDNHYFTYWGDRQTNSDFARRITLYEGYGKKFSTTEHLPDRAAQIIAVLQQDPAHFNRIRNGLEQYQITRTTSPLDGKSIWMEIFPPGVSKGEAAAWLCNHLDISTSASLGIGNDYNDITLLQQTRY